MALDKQPININFSKGLDGKTDPFQLQVGNFLALENSIFDTLGRLTKRNGFGALASLPDASSTYLTTFNGNLTAVGSSIQAYNESSNAWVSKGTISSVGLSTLSLIRSNTNQTQADSALSSNGLVCTVFTDMIPVMGTPTASYKYVVADAITGQNIVSPTVIPVPTGSVSGSPRVFTLGKYFIIVVSVNISGTYHLQYLAINSISPSIITTATDVTSQYAPATTVAFDGVVVNNNLILAWNGSDMGGAVRLRALTSTLTLSSAKVFTGVIGTLFSVTADASLSTPVIYVSFYDSGSQDGYTLAVNQNLNEVLTPTQIISSEDIANIASTAENGVCTFFYETNNTYSYDSGIATNYIQKNTINQGGTVGTAAVLIRAVGLASKAALHETKSYFLTAYDSPFQPTYFLYDSDGTIIAKLAYSNGGGYLLTGLPSLVMGSSSVQCAYLIKDTVQAANKEQTAASASPVYTQTGINLATFAFDPVLSSAEIAKDLHLSGGFLRMYDGYLPVEHGFLLWPDSVEVGTSTSGGLITDQQYFYQVTYEWSDNQGNVFRSAPSVPVTITTTGSNTSTNTIDIPTLRQTFKIENPVKIVIYRWSVAQQTYYQVTSIANPLLNDPTVDSVQFTDTFADSSILGNNILYTTGGVVENIAPPATNIMSLSKSRLMLVDAENPDNIWFSKQVLQNTPVELNDQFTYFVSPTAAVQENTGPIRALSALDDKTIVFKSNAIYYFTGTGPDNTGAQNDFSEPVFITSTVGCNNQRSIVFIPQGLMFQSDKGIWLLDRSLNTSYIGAGVENLTQGATVLSAVNVPETNQVRFTLDSGITLMYDYFYGQWGTFTHIPAISSTIYQDLHTYINQYGQVLQETPGRYLDNSSPVLLAFTTGWLNLAGLQGYERFYFLFLLGKYYTPFKLNVQFAFDYNESPEQSILVVPDNYSPKYGGESLWGSGQAWGGPGNIFKPRLFPQKQKVEAFQIIVKEVFDPSLGQEAGAGLTLSGMNAVVGLKKGYRPNKASQSFG